MDIFRLTYFICGPKETDKWMASERFEVYGSAEAICSIYLSLKNLERCGSYINDLGAIPRFIEVYSKDGVNLTTELNKNGLPGLYSNTDNTFK